MKIFGKRFKKSVLSLALILAFISSASAGQYVRGTLQTTDKGQLQGFEKDGSLHWYGIPYAQTPEGELRWKAPRPVEKWEGVFDASQSLAASQMGNVKVKQEDGSEKTVRGLIGSAAGAVTLDITRPDTEETKLPVLVYLHGGNNQTGRSSQLTSTKFAKDINAVVVSINTRLGLYGFNPLPAVRNGTAEENSGNFTLLDIAAALDWVAANIESFGGDSGNITMSGSSSGGRDTMVTLISPLFKGKFHKAISFSGGMTTSDPDQAARMDAHLIAPLAVKKGYKSDEAEAESWLLTDGDDVREFLYSLTEEEGAAAIGSASIRMAQFPHLFRDGTVIPADAFDTDTWNEVPLLMVNSDSEFSTFCKLAPIFRKPTPAELVADKELVKEYKFAETYGSMMYGYFNGEGSAIKMLGRYSAPMYTCTIQWGDDPDVFGDEMGIVYGSYHCITTPLMTGRIVPPASRYPEQYASDGFKDVSRTLSAYYSNFIRTGDPNGIGLVKWEPFTSAEGTTQLLVTGNLTTAGARMSSDHTSYEKIMDMMEADETIPSERKIVLIKTVLNGRWFSDALDKRYETESLWVK